METARGPLPPGWLDVHDSAISQLTQAVVENATLQARATEALAARVRNLEDDQPPSGVHAAGPDNELACLPAEFVENLALQGQVNGAFASRLLALERAVSEAFGQDQGKGALEAASERRPQQGTTDEPQSRGSSLEIRHFCGEMTQSRRANSLTAVRVVDPSHIQLSDCHFYHSMKFPDGSEVFGDWDIQESFADYIGNIDVKGKTLLDVGTASGLVAFEAERRGARVTAYETPSLANVVHIPFKSNLYYTDHAAWVRQADTGGHAQVINSFWYAHHRFKSNVQVVYGDLFELADLVPPMDIVVAGAILEHISDPIRAIEVFSKIAKETIVLASTPVVESDESVMRPITNMDDPRFDYTWFAPSIGLLRRVFQNVGFRITKLGTSRQYARFQNAWATRPTIVAARV